MPVPDQNNLQSAWNLPGPLSDISWFRDWDYYIASFTSVQKYWNDFGTFPLWNFHFCGGRPELANPQNWTLTALHPLIYLFQPLYLILFIWLLMTIVGAWATAALIERRTGHWPSSVMAGAVYALSGYFSAHFNQGVFTFAFLHLIPLLMLITDRRMERPTFGNSVALFLTTTFFFTSALPHGLFYFYPAYMLFIGCLFYFHRKSGNTFRQALQTLYPHLLGAGAACYKLLPVMAWQRLYPRTGVRTESLSPLQMLRNMLRVDADYDNMLAQVFDGQFWFLWEYSAFIGSMPLAAALFGIYFWLRYQRAPRHPAGEPDVKEPGTGLPQLMITGAAIAGAGVLLASGNEQAFSPGYWFKQLPLVGGIRVFGRYQIMIIFGTALIAGIGFYYLTHLKGWSRFPRTVRKTMAMLFVILVLTPVLLQNFLHFQNIRGVTFSDLTKKYQPPGTSGLQLTSMQGDFIKTGFTHHDFLLKHNGIIANCYDPLTLERPPVFFSPEQRWLELSTPPPAGVSANSSSMTLSYDGLPGQQIILNLTNGVYPVRFSTPSDTFTNAWDKDQPKISLSDNNAITITAEIPGWRTGLLLSLVCLAVFVTVEYRNNRVAAGRQRKKS